MVLDAVATEAFAAPAMGLRGLAPGVGRVPTDDKDSFAAVAGQLDLLGCTHVPYSVSR